MNKKIVHYKGPYHIHPAMGCAFLHPLDHPDSENVSNKKLVRTSYVVNHDPATGIVETENTIYHPVKELT